MKPEADWRDELLSERSSKDHAFRHEADSPIPPPLRGKFTGLAYYPPDPALRFELALRREPEAPVFSMATSTGVPRSYRKWGSFEFPVAGAPARLAAYRQEHAHGEEFLFVPFRDATSGKETYGAGRYIDLPFRLEGPHVLDLNRAYNPYCAYNPRYSCPLPPVENWLKVPIRAGEREFPLKEYVDEPPAP
jgi:hypothetical protein